MHSIVQYALLWGAERRHRDCLCATMRHCIALSFALLFFVSCDSSSKRNTGDIGSSHEIGGAATQQCSTCHVKDGHASAPRSHRGDWMERHGRAHSAAYDTRIESKCSVCHKNSYCLSCHEEQPTSKSVNWSPRQEFHCYSCHLPLGTREEGCQECHSRVEHRSAPARPTDKDHTGVESCKACHSAMEIPHINNDALCSSCH